MQINKGEECKLAAGFGQRKEHTAETELRVEDVCGVVGAVCDSTCVRVLSKISMFGDLSQLTMETYLGGENEAYQLLRVDPV